MEGYQVSNQCQAVVKDRCLVPTKDAPELAYIKESSAQQYVPDVYFKVGAKVLTFEVRVIFIYAQNVHFRLLFQSRYNLVFVQSKCDFYLSSKFCRRAFQSRCKHVSI